MAYSDQNGGGYQPSREPGYPPRDQRDPPESHYPPPSRDPRGHPESQYPPPPSRETDPYLSRDPREPQSQYPPPPGEEDDRARAYHHPHPQHHRAPSGSNGVTLPPMSPYENPSPYGSQQPPPQQSNGYPPGLPQGYPQGQYNAPPAGYRNDRPPYQQPPQDYGRPGQQHMAFSQSAPRQRTAIACRYCRRRKIRCSGFDANPEGRCSNCVRFQQDCVFTPVSSQAQAFVPAHTVYPHMRQSSGMNMAGHEEQTMYPRNAGATPQLYGAHGQPLGPVPPPSGHGDPRGNGPQYDYPAPSPTGSYNSMDRGQTPRSQDSAAYSSHDRAHSARTHESIHSPMDHCPPSRSHEPMQSPHDRSQPLRHHEQMHAHEYSQDPMHSRDRVSPTGSTGSSRKRPAEEQHHDSVLPPPMPHYSRSDSANRRQAIESEHRLPPLTPTAGMPPSNYSPGGSSASSASNLQPHAKGLPSRTPPPLRNSPGGGGRTDPMNLSSIIGDFGGSKATDNKMVARFGPGPR